MRWRHLTIDSFTPEFTPTISTHPHANLLSESREFYKNGDKFDRVKYWRMTFNLSNSPKFPPGSILHYTVLM